MSIHVVFCAHDRPGNFSGGPNSWLQRLLPDLTKNGLQVTLLVLGVGCPESCPLVLELQSQGVPIRYLDATGRYHYLQNRLRWIIDQLNELQPDAFVPNVVIAAYFAVRWVRAAGIPSIGVIHSRDIFHHHLLDTFVRGRKTNRVNAVVAVSEYIKNETAQDIVNSVILEKIPCGVPAHENISRSPSEGLRAAYVGRFRQEAKRIRDVTTAFCLASRALPDATFTLLGDGPELGAMAEIIAAQNASKSVQIKDPLPVSRILEFMQSQDVFVLLSDYEGLPIALQEAMAVGTVPVCLKEDSGVSELIQHGENGLIVTNRGADFVAALNRLDGDRNLLAQLAANAQETIRLEYAAEDQHKKWLSLITHVAEVGPKRPIRLPINLRLPASHPSFRGEDIHAPLFWERSKKSLHENLTSLRLLIRPRSRLREAWRKISNGVW